MDIILTVIFIHNKLIILSNWTKMFIIQNIKQRFKIFTKGSFLSISICKLEYLSKASKVSIFSIDLVILWQEVDQWDNQFLLRCLCRSNNFPKHFWTFLFDVIFSFHHSMFVTKYKKIIPVSSTFTSACTLWEFQKY